MKKILSSLLVAALLITGVVATHASAQTSASASNANEKQLVKAEKAITINARGIIKIKGIVTGKSGNTIMLSSWGGTWSIDTTNAKLVKRFGGTATLADIQNNDVLEVEGTASATNLNVTAKLVRDLSIQQRNGTFVGVISQIDTGAQTFMLTPIKRAPVKILVSSTTQMVTSGNKALTFSDLKEGDSATVIGSWDRTNSNLTATKIIVRKINPHREDNGRNAKDDNNK